MKKLLLPLTLMVFVLASSSCEKNNCYKCVLNTTKDGKLMYATTQATQCRVKHDVIEQYETDHTRTWTAVDGNGANHTYAETMECTLANYW